jgi:DNA-binding ferritin-like protein
MSTPLSSSINLFLGLQSQLKICHWQTANFGWHEAFGNIYNELDDLIDEFVEAAMGKYGRPELSDDEKVIEINNISDLDLEAMMKTVREALVQLEDNFEESDTDLMGIRDDILGKINKLSYLITLK